MAATEANRSRSGDMTSVLLVKPFWLNPGASSRSRFDPRVAHFGIGPLTRDIEADRNLLDRAYQDISAAPNWLAAEEARKSALGSHIQAVRGFPSILLDG
jgi:hypothetical protein